LLLAGAPIGQTGEAVNIQVTSVVATQQQQVPQESQNFFLQLFKHREQLPTKEQLKELAIEAEKHGKTLDKANIPAGLNSYLKGKMKLVLEEIRAKAEGKKPGKAERIKSSIEEMKLVIEFAKGLEKVGYSLNIAIPRQAITEIKIMFGMLREYSTEDRLKVSGLERKEYKDLVTNLTAVLPVVNRYSEIPRPQAAYGQPRLPKVPKIETSAAPVNSVTGEITVKQVKEEEQALKKDMTLYCTSVVDNAKEEAGKITFSNGMFVTVGKKEILTGMELVPEYQKMDEKLEGEIKVLLKELENDDAEKRDKATGRFKEIGPVCKKFLDEELKKTSDPEVKSRIEGILKDFETKAVTNPIVDNLKASLN
jgi:hypothetical protein